MCRRSNTNSLEATEPSSGSLSSRPISAANQPASGSVSLFNRAMCLPFARMMPSLQARAKPKFLLSFMKRASGISRWTISSESSVDPLSTTISSKDCSLCWRKAGRHIRR